MKFLSLLLLSVFINSVSADVLTEKLYGFWIYNKEMTIENLDKNYSSLEVQTITANIATYIHEYTESEFKLYYKFHEKSIEDKIEEGSDIKYPYKIIEINDNYLVISHDMKSSLYEQKLHF